MAPVGTKFKPVEGIMTRCGITAAILAVALGMPWLAAPASAQTTSSLTATYQASVAEYRRSPWEYPANLAGPGYRAYGIMLGMERHGQWWSPHLWLQRYDLLNVCLDPRPGDVRCKGDGWSLSVGPSLRFLDGASFKGSILPQIGLDSRGNQELTGGAGIHLGWHVGFFQPQAFGRFQTMRGWSYVTVGVGLRIELSSQGDSDPPTPRGFGPGR
jgi:hypothetical protein